jgi:hypothetical protein
MARKKKSVAGEAMYPRPTVRNPRRISSVTNAEDDAYSQNYGTCSKTSGDDFVSDDELR